MLGTLSDILKQKRLVGKALSLPKSGLGPVKK